MKTLIILLSFLPLMWSCCSKVAVIPPLITTTKTERFIQKDTIIQTKPDSTYYKALIECENGKPKLTRAIKSKQKTNKGLKMPKVELSGNDLLISCELEAQELFFEWKERYIEESTIEIRPQYIPLPLKWWQKTLMWLGSFSSFIGIGLLVSVLIRKTIRP